MDHNQLKKLGEKARETREEAEERELTQLRSKRHVK
jgi:hypothetical protein